MKLLNESGFTFQSIHQKIDHRIRRDGTSTIVKCTLAGGYVNSDKLNSYALIHTEPIAMYFSPYIGHIMEVYEQKATNL